MNYRSIQNKKDTTSIEHFLPNELIGTIIGIVIFLILSIITIIIYNYYYS
jgi:hypothetical protein